METIKLTPLHWAAYNDDAELCRYLLYNGAHQIESDAGSTPVDIAGFTGHKRVVKVFMEHVAAKIDTKYGITGPGVNTEEEEKKIEQEMVRKTEHAIDLHKKVNKPKFNELEYLNKLEKSPHTGQYKILLAKEKMKELSKED